MPTEQESCELDGRGSCSVAASELEVRLEVRIDETGDPLAGEPVEVAIRGSAPDDVVERAEVGSLARQRQQLGMTVQQVLQQRRAAAMMPAHEHGIKQPLERVLALGGGWDERTGLRASRTVSREYPARFSNSSARADGARGTRSSDASAASLSHQSGPATIGRVYNAEACCMRQRRERE